MSDISPIKANLDIKADLTKSAEDVTAMAKDTHKGVGKLFYALLGPWIEERIGKAKRGAAQAEKDSLDILAGHARLDEETKTMISIGNVSSVDALCEELEKANSQCKAKRLTTALMVAAIEMKQIPEEEVADEPLNQTFFNHWRAEAELIDDEDLRQWWAHLLVEETKKPNSISPRTLDVAKNLAKDEALLFQRLLKGCFKDYILPGKDGAVTFGNYHETTIMNDAGLFHDKGRIPITCQYEDSVNGKQILLPFMDVDSVIVIETEKVQLIGNPLTRAGVELRNAIGIKRTQEDIITIADNLQIIPDGIFKIKVYNIKEKIFAQDGTLDKYNWFPTPVWEKRLPNNE